jgi:hypothetical protein
MSAARIVVIVAGVLATLPALAGEMRPEEARRFVAGKLFAYSCFDGTSGAGRIFADGSVAGTVQMQGKGPVRYAMMPAGTLKVKNEAVCATVKGLPFEPCFNLTQTDPNSFRGSIRGLNFAYCTFTKRNPRTNIARASTRPLALRASATASAGSN